MPQHWDYRRAPAQCNLRTLIKALVATRTILRLGLNFGRRDEHVWLGKGPARGIGNRSALRSPSGARGEPEAVSDAGVQVLRCGDATVCGCNSQGQDVTPGCRPSHQPAGRVLAKRT